jgi:hypothetical protein
MAKGRRDGLPIFLFAGLLPDKHDDRSFRAFPEHRLGVVLVESITLARLGRPTPSPESAPGVLPICLYSETICQFGPDSTKVTQNFSRNIYGQV